MALVHTQPLLALAHRDHEPPLRGELIEERLRHLGGRGGDQDAVERRLLGESPIAISRHDDDVVEAEAVERTARPLGQSSDISIVKTRRARRESTAAW